MSLTAITLQVNQSQPGWAGRAVAEGSERLQQAGLPALARELKREAADTEEPAELLRRYLRLELVSGAAAPSVPAVMARGGLLRRGVFAAAIGRRMRVVWRAGTDGWTGCSPVVSACGKVLFVGRDGTLRCADLNTGGELWRTRLSPHDTPGSPAISACGRALVSDGLRGSLCCLDLKDGRTLWRFETDGWIRTSPAITDDGKVLFGSHDRHLYCLDLQGRELWRFKADGELDGAPAVAGERVVFGDSEHHLYAVELESGQQLWRRELPGEVYSGPAVFGGRVLAPSRDGSLCCVHLETGEELWKAALAGPIGTSVAVSSGDRVLFGMENRRLYCLDLVDGQGLWSAAAEQRIESDPVISGCGKVIFGAADHILRCVALESGRMLWRRRLDSEIMGSPFITDCGRLLVCSGGFLYCLKPRKDLLACLVAAGRRLQQRLCRRPSCR